jgi:hypothetical protein
MTQFYSKAFVNYMMHLSCLFLIVGSSFSEAIQSWCNGAHFLRRIGTTHTHPVSSTC